MEVFIIANKACDKNGNIYYANNKKLDYNGDYYCCNSDCNVKMKLKNYIGTNSNKPPYFSALKGSSHIDGCKYDGRSENLDRYDTKNIDIDGIFSSTFDSSKSSSKKIKK